MTTLRQRMLEDLRLRKYAENTQKAYISNIARFATCCGKCPSRLGLEQIRSKQIFLVEEKKLGWSALNTTVCAFRFLYWTTLKRNWDIRHIPYARVEKKLPVVLSRSETLALFEAIDNTKQRVFSISPHAALRRSAVMPNVAAIVATRC